MFQHRIEDRQQLAYAGGECHLLHLSRSLQALIEDRDHWIESGGDNGPHVQNSANLRGGHPTPSVSPGASHYRDSGGHANEGGDLLIRQQASILHEFLLMLRARE